MRLNFLVILFIQILALQSHAAELFIWQPTESHVPIILGREDNQTPEQAAKEYLQKFNLQESLVSLNDGPLDIPLEGFRDFRLQDPSKAIFLILTNNPSQITGNKNSKIWFRRLAYRKEYKAEVYVLPVTSDIAMSEGLATDFRKLLTQNFDSILALGGDDLDPSIYGDKNRHAKKINKLRDTSEMKVIREFANTLASACFGICRGMQLTAASLGYKLRQDIKAETSNTHNHVNQPHKIKILKENSLFQKKFEGSQSIEVNSYHHQSVIAESNPNGPLTLVAVHQGSKSEEAIAEIMEFKNGLGFLLQFHPEKMNSKAGNDIMDMMVDLTEKTKSYKNRNTLMCSRIFAK